MGVFIREKFGHLYLDYTINGHRHTEALHLKVGKDKKLDRDAWRLAEAIRSRKELQLVSAEHGLLDPVEAKRPLYGYAEAIAVKQPPKNALPKSLKYLREFAGTIQLGAVTEKWVSDYREFLLEKKVIGKATASKYFSAIKMVLHRAVRDSIIPRNPADDVQGISIPETEIEYLTPEELDRLAQTPLGGTLGAEIKKAFLFQCYVGLRPSDQRTLTWGNIQRGETWKLQKKQSKTQRIVAMDIHPSAVKILKDTPVDIHPHDELVFPCLSQSKANTNQYLKAWAKAANIDKHIGWNLARHTFGTSLLENGADVSVVSRLMGHTKLSTTMRYLKTTDSAKQKAIEGLPELKTGK